MARQVAWVAYHDGVDRVEILKKRVDPARLLRPCANPLWVEDEEGDRFVVSADRCFDNPMDAHLAAVKLRQENGIEGELEEPEEEEYEDEEDSDAEDPDEEDELDD
jgi:hypothetical protein